MFNYRSVILLFLTAVFSFSCERSSIDHWSGFIPDTAPFILVPQPNSSIADLLEAPYFTMMDDITPSALQVTETLYQEIGNQGEIEALVLYTDTSNDWQPVWVMKSVDGLITRLALEYQRLFEQSRYTFKGKKVNILFVSDRQFYITEIGNWILFSESSLAIENHIRASLDSNKAMNVDKNSIEPGSFIVNTPRLDRWTQQLAQVLYRPYLDNAFDGGAILPLKMSDNPDSEWSWQLSGTMPFGNNPSVLLRSVTRDAGEFKLDRYVPMNSAAFSILRLPPRMVPPDDIEVDTETDRHLESESGSWREIAETLGNEIAFATFAESGPSSTSEYLYIRELENSSELRSILRRLAAEDIIVADGDAFLIQSNWLGKLIGSEMNPMTNFYLTIYRDVAVIAQRKGLAESVASDASRRRVMYYSDDYMMVRNNQEGPFSSLTYIDSALFGTYIQPWLYPQNYFGALAANLDLFVITTSTDNESGNVDIEFSSYQRDLDDQPFRERWVFPTGGSDITGVPALADISGSARKEVIFSTKGGSVYALATDGTMVLQVDTEIDEPIGSPVIYDWYGNNQNVIMQAAGNRVYAWNTNGTALPNFPITLDEQITTPLMIKDVTRNGVAEIIVGTADRRVHILNSRGQPISGWPQTTNSTVTEKPVITQLGNQRSIFVAAENTIHAWGINGESRNGFPVFLDTQIHGQPAVINNHIYGAGMDGTLYSVGTESVFSDTLASYVKNDSLKVQALQISSAGLNATPSMSNLMLRSEDELIREDLLLVQSSNGGLFLYNKDGMLRFTASLGQPTSGYFPPVIDDIDRNRRMNLIALADFGRLYAWDILSGQRLYDLPTNAMKYPLIADLTGDGNNEIIAHTREGLRAWTIFETSTENN